MIAKLPRCRPLRGLAHGGIVIAAAITQGSRTRPGLHAVARYAGSCAALHLWDVRATKWMCEPAVSTWSEAQSQYNDRHALRTPNTESTSLSATAL